MSRNKDTHLTVDLDYFTNADFECLLIDDGYRFIDRLLKTYKSIVLVESHEEILEYINAYKYSRIVNVDYHSDVADEPVTNLNEGTWANFYKYRKDCKYEWRVPNRTNCVRYGYGRCDSGAGEFNTRVPKSKFGYQSVSIRTGIYRIGLERVRDVTICRSRDWTYSDDLYFYVKRKLLERELYSVH